VACRPQFWNVKRSTEARAQSQSRSVIYKVILGRAFVEFFSFFLYCNISDLNTSFHSYYCKSLRGLRPTVVKRGSTIIAVTHTRCRHINHRPPPPPNNTTCSILGLLAHPCHTQHSNLLSQRYFQHFSIFLYGQ
jgi:hypothetical protein